MAGTTSRAEAKANGMRRRSIEEDHHRGSFATEVVSSPSYDLDDDDESCHGEVSESSFTSSTNSAIAAVMETLFVLGFPSPSTTGSDEAAEDRNDNDDSDDDEEDDIDDDKNNLDHYKIKQDEIQTLINDQTEFHRLQSALKAKGAITNELARQRLHIYLSNNRERLRESLHKKQQQHNRRHNQIGLQQQTNNPTTTTTTRFRTSRRSSL